MRGTTHLAIGTAIGAGSIVYYSAYSLESTVWYLSVAAFSALSADLDAPSILTGKLSFLSKLLRELLLWAGLIFVIAAASAYYTNRLVHPELTTAATAVTLLGLIAKQGVIRNALVSAIGGCLLYTGLMNGFTWLLGFGLFVAIVPWLKHRGMTHTIWAVLIWSVIARELEHQLQLDGITIVAMLSYTSHLIADSLTPKGVKWFYPLYKKSIKL